MTGSPSERLIARLDAIGSLGAAELQALRALPFATRDLRPRQELVRDGDRPTQCCLVVEGVLGRIKVLADGERQIISLHIPGDVPDLHSLHLDVMDHTLAALTASTVAVIPHEAMREIIAAHPALGNLFWRETLIDAAIFREWIVNIGRRNAYSRIAHLFCEIFMRLKAVGLTDAFQFDAPMTQSEMAEATGLTPVHVNRVLQRMRVEGLIGLTKKRWTIENWPKLSEAAGFDATYLHEKRASGTKA